MKTAFLVVNGDGTSHAYLAHNVPPERPRPARPCGCAVCREERAMRLVEERELVAEEKRRAHAFDWVRPMNELLR